MIGEYVYIVGLGEISTDDDVLADGEMFAIKVPSSMKPSFENSKFLYTDVD